VTNLAADLEVIRSTSRKNNRRLRDANDDACLLTVEIPAHGYTTTCYAHLSTRKANGWSGSGETAEDAVAALRRAIDQDAQ
jgi:hypothetical protein